jgi:peptide-methionine (R)-S-oxide reductase
MLTKRQFLLSGSSVLGVAALGGAFAMFRMTPSAATEESFEITKSEDEWRKVLTPAQYDVLRDHGTERAFTSPLDSEKRAGLFHCAGCDLPVYSSETKFDSGTGWPSFYQPLDNAVGTSVDTKFFMTRTEVHCRRCGGHLGHVFDDGPPPTGKRHCINGVAMTFHPGATQSS